MHLSPGLNSKPSAVFMLRRLIVLLIVIHLSDGDVKAWRYPWCLSTGVGYVLAPGFTFSLPFITIPHATLCEGTPLEAMKTHGKCGCKDPHIHSHSTRKSYSFYRRLSGTLVVQSGHKGMKKNLHPLHHPGLKPSYPAHS